MIPPDHTTDATRVPCRDGDVHSHAWSPTQRLSLLSLPLRDGAHEIFAAWQCTRCGLDIWAVGMLDASVHLDPGTWDQVAQAQRQTQPSWQAVYEAQERWRRSAGGLAKRLTT